jgi:hypothetical protein
MRNTFIVCFVVVIAIVLAIMFLMPMESYCGCEGINSMTNKPPYTFWRGAEWPLPYEARRGFDWDRGDVPFRRMKDGCINNEYVASRAQKRQNLDIAYGMDENTERDLYRDRVDGLLDVGVNYDTSLDARCSNNKAVFLSTMMDKTPRNYSSKNCCGGIGSYPNDNEYYNAHQKLVSLDTLGASLPPGAVTNASPLTSTRIRYGDGKFMERSPPGTYRFGGYDSCVGNAAGFHPEYSRASVGVL